MNGEGIKMAKRGDLEGPGNRTKFTCISFTVNHVEIVRLIKSFDKWKATCK